MKDLFNLEGKVALVTGAGRGFGRAFSLALAEAGAHLVCAEKVPETLDETAALVRERGQRVLPLEVDVARPADVMRMSEDISSEYGQLDIAVNNAGMVHKPYRFHETPIEEWNRLMAINMTGVFLCMQREIKLMLLAQKGVIINIASILGLRGLVPELCPRVSYVAAKHAVIGLTKQAALEYAGDGIRVNAIAPGWFEGTAIARERLAGVEEEFYKERAQRIIDATPMKRRGQIQELLGLLLYLASDASSFVTGQTFVIDGGWTAY